jgi:uncharacterized protein
MRDRECAEINNIIDEIVTDGKTSVKPITSTASVADEGHYHDRTSFKEPTIIVAFPGPGMVGSITANYIIEHLHMHEIAFVESEFIIPGIIYIGGKLRHLFRIYANNDGTICVILCEIPIIAAGIYSVLNTIVKWTVKCNPKEVIVLGGFPVEGIPGPDRKTLILSTHNIKAAYADGEVQPIEDRNTLVFVEGISAGLLASCLSNGIKCRGLFVRASNSIPDPEGAAMLIEAINALGHRLLNIDVRPLRQKGENIRKRMEELIKVMLAQQRQEHLRIGEQRMYT